MTEIVTIPPVRIVQGHEAYFEYAFEDVDGPVDLTEWQVEAVLSDKPFDPPFWRSEIDAGADGVVRLIIPGSDTSGFSVQPLLGGSPSAVLQITLNAPDPEFSKVWQGPAIIAGVFT